MSDYKAYNAQNVLDKVNEYIRIIESGNARKFLISDVFEELSIFDWWHEYLSLSQLKAMRSFLNQAIKLGFTGYVCFKVGAAGFSHGMWAHVKESEDGYSPNDNEILFHSFRSGDNYFSVRHNGEWHHNNMSLSEVKVVLQGV